MNDEARQLARGELSSYAAWSVELYLRMFLRAARSRLAR